MRIINNPTIQISSKKTAIALGRFDGVHVAHQMLIEQTQNTRFVSAVFAMETNNSYITAPNIKQNIIEALGVDILIRQELSELKHMEAQEFFERYIIGTLNAGKVVVGFNFMFGENKQGDVKLLQKLCGEHGVEICVVPPCKMNCQAVSSTHIRRLIAEGDLPTVEKFLGYTFAVCGEVVEGDKIGAVNGFPTANITLDERQIMPPQGVYASRCNVLGKMYDAVTHYGIKPTVGITEPTLETHILNFDTCSLRKQLYGVEITIFLEERIRKIKKFNCLKTLKNQTKEDIGKINCKKMEKSTCQNFPIDI